MRFSHQPWALSGCQRRSPSRRAASSNSSLSNFPGPDPDKRRLEMNHIPHIVADPICFQCSWLVAGACCCFFISARRLGPSFGISDCSREPREELQKRSNNGEKTMDNVNSMLPPTSPLGMHKAGSLPSQFIRDLQRFCHVALIL